MGSGTYGASRSQPQPAPQLGQSGKGMQMQPQPAQPPAQMQPGMSGKGALLANRPAQPQSPDGYMGARTGTETPEQLANMAANAARSPEERNAYLMADLQQSQQGSFEALNQARQAGFQVDPTPNQVPNPYANMTTAQLQQMNAQMDAQAAQEQMASDKMRMQQRAMNAQMPSGPPQQAQMNAQAPQAPMASNPYDGMRQAPMQQFGRSSKGMQQAPMQQAPRSAKGGQQQNPMMNSGLGAMLARRMSR